MKFAIRQEVGIENYRERLAGVKDVPIELAMPYKLDDYLDQAEAGLLDALAICIRENNNVVHSVHATQGHLTDLGFMRWALETARFGEKIRAGIVVFHPEQTRKDRRLDTQIIALQNINRLRRETAITVAVETFGGPKRVLSPEDIVQKGFPMVLDTSHLLPDKTMEIIRSYHKAIVAVHLSEPREGRQHMPVEGFGFEVLDVLKAVGWDGCTTLEYLPEFRDRLVGDREALEELYGGK